MNRADFTKLWHDAWDGEGWFAPWKKGLEKLTPDQAAWKPQPGRNSIWQHVNHVIFWRKYTKATIEGAQKPTDDEVAKLNFAEPSDKSASAWKKTLEDLESSHKEIEAILSDDKKPLDRVQHHLMHDAYHMGQIQLLLAMQGMSPVM